MGDSTPVNKPKRHSAVTLLAVSMRESGSYSAWCPEVDVASQGDSVEEAVANLKEALELHLESLTTNELAEIQKRAGTRFTTTIEIPVPA